MKAILEFNLDDHEDRIAHLRCVKSTDMAIVLFDLHKTRKLVENKLESGIRYTDSEILDFVFEEINDLLTQQNLNIEELIS